MDMARGNSGRWKEDLRIRLAGAALFAIQAGCAAKRGVPQATFHDPNMDFSLVHTVAVLPFANLTPTQSAAERVRDVFATVLQATGGVYVLPPGEVAKGIARVNPASATSPSAEEVMSFAKAVNADAVITGIVLEYGEARSGSATANYISISVKMMEAKTGKIVWSAASTRGGVGASQRLFGGGGEPMNEVTARAVDDLIDQLFKK